MPDFVREALPAEPSRRSGRVYMLAIIALLAAEAIVSAVTDYHGWQVLAVADGALVACFAIVRAGTSLDLNKWVQSAKDMYLASKGMKPDA